MPEGPYNYRGRKAGTRITLDPAATISYEIPLNRLTGKMWKKGALPLWNPYTAAGTPVLADWGSRVFFPLQIIEDVFPARAWNYFLLLRVWLAGVFTFLLLRELGMTWFAGLAGGVFYMLSGPAVWFMPFEEMQNGLMLIPLLLLVFERLVKRPGPGSVFLAAPVVALHVFSGSPELTFVAFFFTGVYALYRAATVCGRATFKKPLLYTAVAFVLGISLSAVQILPFAENLRYTSSAHEFGSKAAGTIYITPFVWIMTVVVPYFWGYLHAAWHPDMVGLWNHASVYTGATGLFLIVLGILTVRRRPVMPFFALFATFFFLKFYGALNIIGRIPVFNMVIFPRWAGPVLSLCLAVLAAGGASALEEGPSRMLKRAFGISIAILVVLLLFSIPYLPVIKDLTAVGFLRARDLSPGLAGRLGMSDLMLSGYAVFSSAGGIVTALAFIFIAFRLAGRSKLRGFKAAFMVLVIAELYIYIPHGFLRALPFMLLPAFLVIGSVVLWIRKPGPGVLWAGVAMALVASALVNILSPKGQPDVHDPFAIPPYVEFLRGRGGLFRVTGIDRVLSPNYAAAFDLQDVRYLNPLPIDWYRRYVVTALDGEDRPLWFDPAGEKGYGALLRNIRSYSLLGVKYILAPADSRRLDGSLPLVYDREVRIYENPGALPRAFLVNDFLTASSYEEAQDVLKRPGFDPVRTAVVESEAPPGRTPHREEGRGGVRIIKYTPGNIEIEARADGPSMLVLTDVYHPGWHATVNGRTAKVVRVDGLVTGVFLEKGLARVVFHYLPSGFVYGAAISISAILLWLGLVVFNKRRPV